MLPKFWKPFATGEFENTVNIKTGQWHRAIASRHYPTLLRAVAQGLKKKLLLCNTVKKAVYLNSKAML